MHSHLLKSGAVFKCVCGRIQISELVLVTIDMVIYVLLALCIAMSGGVAYAFLVQLLGLSPFFVCVIDGTLLVLFFMENMVLVSDLEKRFDPDAALLKADKAQREMIRQLSQQRAVLQQQVLSLEASLKKRKALKSVISKSCGDIFSEIKCD